MTSTSTPSLAEDLERAARLAAHRVVVHDHVVVSHGAEATAVDRRSGTSAMRAAPIAVGDQLAGTRRARTSTAPSDARCGVVHCTSSNVPPPARMQVDERDHRDLRRVGDAVELRLRREQPADARRRRDHRRAHRAASSPATSRRCAPTRVGAARCTRR